jgi:6-pyruvoyltetrahydropterin/6-carboxytetrahydropterin synthase
VREQIASAHQLLGYEGSCKDIHGHTWRIDAVVCGQQLDEVGLLVDFRLLKQKLKSVTGPLDHVFLNELPLFKGTNPSTENLARYVYRAFAQLCAPLHLKHVQVWESETSSVIYYE